ncbi:MAG: hydroxysqualene dehydroxylase HpnE [Dehalococcoidia bacterium]
MAPKPNPGASLNGRRIAVVGGGLAGQAAAVRVARDGGHPVLLEKRPFLGGRAFSFVDRETGVEVDNGQHVFVGACVQYQEFLKEVGAWSNVRLPRRLDAPVLLNGRISRLKSSNLPGPLANLPALLRYGHLSVSGKMRLLYGLMRIRLAKRYPGGPLERETFDAWLRRHSQNDETIDRFWNLIVLPSLNDNVRDVSADAGVMLFQVALLGRPSNAAIGVSSVGLSALTGGPVQEYIEARGGEVRTGSEARCIELKNGVAAGIRLASGEVLHADSVIIALPSANMLGILPADLAKSAFFSVASKVETAPIVGVHIWYDRPVLEHDFIAVLDGPLQWVFNVTNLQHADDGEGQHVVISLSGAWQWRDQSKAELRETFVTEMARAFPAARSAKVTRFLVIKMLDATFRVRPGSTQHRLPQQTPVKNLFLAGDWTDTGWPSTMESAVRSGNMAAKAALEIIPDQATADA